MSSYCEDCGCKVYNGYCTNCNEESFIVEQDMGNDEHVDFSPEFMDKVYQGEKDAVNRRKKEANKQNSFDEFETCEYCGGNIVDSVCDSCGYNPFLLLDD